MKNITQNNFVSTEFGVTTTNIYFVFVHLSAFSVATNIKMKAATEKYLHFPLLFLISKFKNIKIRYNFPSKPMLTLLQHLLYSHQYCSNKNVTL